MDDEFLEGFEFQDRGPMTDGCSLALRSGSVFELDGALGPKKCGQDDRKDGGHSLLEDHLTFKTGFGD